MISSKNLWSWKIIHHLLTPLRNSRSLVPSVTLKTRMTVPDNEEDDIFEKDNDDEEEYGEESTSLRGSG